jgi:hypothetical protein
MHVISNSFFLGMGMTTLAYVYVELVSSDLGSDYKPSGLVCKYIKTSIFMNTSLYLYFLHYFSIGYTNPLSMKLQTQ